MKRRKDTICMLLRASTFLLRRLLDLISEDSFHTHSVLSSPSRLRYGRNSRASCAKTDGHSSRIPRRRRHLESTEYAAMDSMERIREGVRRRYLAASSRARLILERDDCNGELRAPNWTLNSNDSSPHSSLPLISTPGGSRAGIWVFVGAGSRPVLLQTSRRRPLQLLPGSE
jgi:hypothetical protein